MKLNHQLNFEVGHQDINEWLTLSIIPLAGAIIVLGITWIVWVGFP